ncbi:MAG: ATP-binding protein [Oscillospiraceae bacterium]|nr:ATP-binding protein [Oscillospiraceae bacterium]
MAYIERAITPVLKQRVSSSKCLLLTGARQVGKSTMLRHVFSDYNRANFDDRLTRLQAKEEPKLFFLNNPRPLFIDEVQKESSILEEIKLIVDNSEARGEFILSGSQKLELMKGMSESLAGRVSVLELSTLSMRELAGISFNRHFVPTTDYLAQRETELKPYSDVWEKIHHGFYPERYDVERDWQDFYSSYVATYLERDINELIAADSLTFAKFMTAVAARTGELLNYANIADEAGVSQPTVKTWISILERTGIVYLLQPYSASALTRAIKTPKLYFRDTGLACYLTRWLTADALKNSAVAGNMFETFVISEILKSYSNEGKDYRFGCYYYRGRDKRASVENEIDLIIEENGILYPVEIKLTGNPKASMGATNQVLDQIPDKQRGMGVILCLIDKKTYLRENLLALPIEYL